MLASIDVAAFFALGAVGWWVLLIAGFITLLALTEYEQYGWTGFVGFAIVAFLQLAGGVDILGWIGANPATFFILLAGYAAIGVVYSLVKWRFSFLRRAREEFDVLQSQWDELKDENGIVRVRANFKTSGAEPLEKNDWLASQGWSWEKIRVRYNKARITAWIAYWPWNLLWTLIDDPFRKLAEWLYATFKGWYEAAQANAFKGVDVPK